MKQTGGEIVAQMLQKEGVTIVFGIIDGTYFGLYAKLKKYGIKLISPRHESSAVHMAGAYARISGKLGVCIASNGPGVANALPGVAVENAEGNRVLLLTSSRRNPIVYPDRGGTFQYFNQCGVIGAMAKYSAAATIPERIPELMRQAFRIAFKGRPGLVHVDIPENYFNGKFSFPSDVLRAPKSYRRLEPIAPATQQVTEAIELLSQAKLPIIHAGSGVVHAQAFKELQQLAERLHAPVITSWGARGVLSEEHPLSFPMIHLDLVIKLRKQADLILCLGSRIGETDMWGKMPYWGNPKKQKTIQVDIDEAFLGRNRPVDLAILADAKSFLEALNNRLEDNSLTSNLQQRKKNVDESRKAMAKNQAKLNKKLDKPSVPMNTAQVVKTCQDTFPENAIVVLDGGNTAIWGNFYHQAIVPGHLLSTPKMGMLGAGVSQALGAAVAKPGHPVYCIIGDGAMGFHPQEIETAVRNQLPVIYLVICDKQWGMVKINQQFALKPLKTMIRKTLSPEENINTDFGEIAFDKLAESMGAYGERVADAHELPAAINRCLEQKRCAVIHVDVDPVKHLWAPALLHFKKMHLEPGG